MHEGTAALANIIIGRSEFFQHHPIQTADQAAQTKAV
jgi:hypothetical protein